MKVIIDCSGSEDIEIEEFLEPTFSSYCIRQGDQEISLSEYQLKELRRTIGFLLENR